LAASKSAKSDSFRFFGEDGTGRGPRITILGIGNLLLKDEGVGVHCIQRLADRVNAEEVNLVDGGTTPDILSLVGTAIDKLIIVDAAVVGNEPGTIYRFSADDLASNAAQAVSLHELGVADNLKLMKVFGNCPRIVTIFGVEPKVIDYGMELSPELEEAMPRLVELVLEELIEPNTSMEVAR
jgi:hydrogenase maturation protease